MPSFYKFPFGKTGEASLALLLRTYKIRDLACDRQSTALGQEKSWMVISSDTHTSTIFDSEFFIATVAIRSASAVAETIDTI